MVKTSRNGIENKRSGLLFVAVIPPEIIKKEITELKKKIAEEFNSSHALKSPPHITLVPPFNCPESHEMELFLSLTNVCRSTKRFSAVIQGYGAFRPRVIYLNILQNQDLEKLYHLLNSSLAREESRRTYKPHMTLAFRDLSSKMFYKAWQKYKSRSFNSTFEINSIFLLKHNFKYWEVYREFQFGK